MLRSKTTFVIGAGASAEFALPVGEQLASTIKSHLSMRFDFNQQVGGDSWVYRVMDKHAGEDLKAYGQACWRIVEGLSLHNSIDNFIDNHRHDERIAYCGKLAIARTMMSAERGSSLRSLASTRPDDAAKEMERFKATWLHALFRLMQEGRPFDEVDRFFENSSFVVFNYDRCVQLFFRRALVAAYGVTDERAERVVNSADITHVFGSLGALPGSTATKAVEFGAEHYDLGEVAAGLRTYSEQLDEGAVDEVRRRVAGAECLAFLGFGYIPTNMQLLAPNDRSGTTLRRVVGSAFGIPDYDREAIARDLEQWSAYPSVHVVLDPSAKCANLVANYSRAFR